MLIMHIRGYACDEYKYLEYACDEYKYLEYACDEFIRGDVNVMRMQCILCTLKHVSHMHVI